jgi:tyrosine-protein phosphatase MSG5
MLALREMNADSPLKRSFGETVGLETRYDPFLYLNHTEGHGQKYSPIRPEGLERSHSAFPPNKRRSISISQSTSMPLQSGSATSAVFPSFMSIFGNGGSGNDAGHEKPLPLEQRQQDDTSTHESLPRTHHTQHTLSTPRDHCRSNSVSSLTSESTESSPTTTSSTFDSPLIAEPSPSSSPETPSSTLPELSFRSMMKSPNSAQKTPQSQTTTSADPLIMSTQLEGPAENARNVKNLSLKPTPTVLTRPATLSGAEGIKSLSTDSSPLREPLKTGRRKPPGLSIQTPGFAPLGFTQTTSDVPPTPSTRPSLTHVQSSPQFPTLVGSAGGLRLPLPLNLRGGHSRPGSESSSNISFGGSLHDLKEEDNLLRSQEAVERGYPAGPVQIYDSGVYLYLEPTAEEAANFDMVINVAKEVKNPFDITSSSGSDTVVSALRKEEERSQIPEPQTAISEISFKSAFEWPSSAASTTPTTPRASSTQPKSQPQYIHVPWDHNSEIVDDLYPLCRLIDDQVDAGKKVLIHCQLGVSRSASLIIAYGLYKGYENNFHTMYETVKERSRWVGPNMTLIYQLNDFRSKVEKGNLAATAKAAPREWFKSQAPANETTLTPMFSTMSTSNLDKLSTPPLAVPAAARIPAVSKPNLNKKLPPVPPFDRQEDAKNSNEAGTREALPQAEHTTALQLDTPPELPLKPTTVTRPLPLRDFAGLKEIPPHRPQKADLTTMRRIFSPTQMDLAMSDEPQTPSLFSPRAAEFMASPFGRTVAGEIMMGSVPSNTRPSAARSATRDTIAPEIDPRAPHQTQKGGEIVRSIDDFL